MRSSARFTIGVSGSMKPLTREWIGKAEADYASTEREFRARKNPNHDAVCFFAQQCAEKYLKAFLTDRGIAFPKTHDLEALLDLAVSKQPLWETLRGRLAELTIYAVAFRYPGESASRELARSALQGIRLVRATIIEDTGWRSP